MAEEKFDAVLVIRIASVELKDVALAENPFQFFCSDRNINKGEESLLGLYNHVRKIEFAAKGCWSENGWSIFTITEGKIVYLKAIGGELYKNVKHRWDTKYVMLAKVSMVNEEAAIKASSSVELGIHQRLEHIFSAKDSELEQLAEDCPDGWKFPLFSMGGCNC